MHDAMAAMAAIILAIKIRALLVIPANLNPRRNVKNVTKKSKFFPRTPPDADLYEYLARILAGLDQLGLFVGRHDEREISG